MGALRRSLPALTLLALALTGAMATTALAAGGHGQRAGVGLPSSMETSVTIYGASWCGPCKILESGLKERDIPFQIIDIDRNPDAFERARAATGVSAIPQTSVLHNGALTWVVGADVGAVERAYRGQ